MEIFPWKFKSSRPHHVSSVSFGEVFMDTLVVMPARIGSTRLAEKMMAEVNGVPLIVQTHQHVISAKVGDVIVACDHQRIANAIESVGGTAVLTDPELPSGTDRVFAAWQKIDPEGKYKYVINVQGDLPLIAPEFVQKAEELVKNSDFDISTIVTPIHDDSYKLSSVVKSAIAFSSKNQGQALYFSRSPIPFGGPYYNHVGIYCFKADALRKFVSLPQSNLEKIEKLEQLRAMENGLTIGAFVLEQESPISVDTLDDLNRVRKVATQVG